MSNAITKVIQFRKDCIIKSKGKQDDLCPLLEYWTDAFEINCFKCKAGDGRVFCHDTEILFALVHSKSPIIEVQIVKE